MDLAYSAKPSYRQTSTSPPQFNNYQTTKRGSPLRSSQSPNNIQQYHQIQDDEERRYEERRSEELRRQIREREAELEKISQSKDRLKLRIQNSLSFGLSGQNYSQVIRQSQNSSLTQNKTSPLRQSALSGHSSILKQPVQINKDSLDTANKRNTPRSFKFKPTESPASITDMHQQQSIIASQRQSIANLNPVKNEYMQQIQNDNQQLQRRLNLVVAELDRVTRENNMQSKSLFSVQNEAEQYMRAIQNEEKVDVLQQDLQEEIFMQKEKNKHQEKQLQEIDIQRSETLKKLNLLQEERERQVLNSENLSKGLTTKLQITQDIEFQIQQNKEQAELVQSQIRNVEWEVKSQSQKLPELNLITDKLRRERDELLMKLRQLNDNYEFAVSDISKERAKIETHNRRHLQLLGSKAVFIALQSMVQSRKQESLNEFYNYCHFDKNCHRTLTQLSIIITNCGQYQMKSALQKWFSNALKPKQTRNQGTCLIDRLYRMKLRQRMFKKWHNKVYRQQIINAEKLQAVKKMWEIKSQDVQRDIQRGFTIWRDKTRYQLQQVKALKYLIARQRTTRLREVIVNWQAYCTDVDFAIKHHVLKTQFTQSNLTLIAFSQLRASCAFRKRIRLMRLAHLLKAWKDSNAYRRQMMAQNVQCSHMRKNLNINLLSACFQAIRLNKEHEKFELMQQSLNGNYEPSLRQLQESIKQRAAQALQQKRCRALVALSKQVECKVASYFNHWKSVQYNIQIRVQTNLKEVIQRLYRQATHQAFTNWKNSQRYLQRQQQNTEIEHLQRGCKKLSQDVDSTTKAVNLETMRQQKNARTGLVRASEICVRRYLTFGLRHWHSKCRQLTEMEQVGAGTVIRKLRKYLIKQFFNRFKKQVGVLKKEELAEARCEHYLNTRNQRKIRQIFNAICQYTNMFSFAKKNQEHLLVALTTWLKHKAIRRWRDQSHLKAIQLSKSSQNQNTQVFDSLNQDLGQAVKKLREQESSNLNQQRKLTAQAQRILANTFARFYYIKAERGIKRWVDVIKYQKHQEQLLKSIINHQRKHQFYFIKAAFQNWIQKSKIQEHRIMIKQTVIKTEEAVQINTYKRDQSETVCITQMADLKNNQRNTQQLNNQLQKLLGCIIRKNDDNYFQGFLRNIFTQWAAYTKRQVKFIKAITNTITKSMWQNGFTNIRAFSNDKHTTRVQNKHLVGMRRMFWKKNCQDAFNKWRHYQYAVVNADTANTNMVRATETKIHNQFVASTKDWTMIKGTKYMSRIRLINLLQAWKNVTKWQIAARQNTQTYFDNRGSCLAKRSLKLWINRQKCTVKYRSILVKFRSFKQRLMMHAVFNAIRNRNNNNSNFVTKLSNAVAKFDNRMKENSLQVIRDFVASKVTSNLQKQAIAARNLSQKLNQVYITRMTDNLNTLRCKVRSQKHRELVLSSMFGHWYSRGLREHFQTWKYQSLKAQVVIEVNEEGPVVEEVLNEVQKYNNLQSFMDQQGYTRKEIDEVKLAVEARAKESLARVIQRLRHNTKQRDAYLLPKVFDRWRMFVKVRRLVGYLLRNLDNKLKPVKADLSVAFNRWKKHQSSLLSGIDRGLLIAKCSNLQRQSDQLLKLDDSASQFLHQMEIQRDELVENYIKGQRMAISLEKNNKQRAEYKALQLLSDNAHKHKKYNYEMILQRNINLIQSLKDRIKDFENDNESVASENEELRQFSLDGYQIAKNVQVLSSERESLSIDLADKTRTIQKLLDQNQDLSLQLRDAQAYAIMLINKSNFNMRQLQQHR